MKENLQIKKLFPDFNRLQKIYGKRNLSSIYGAGKIKQPKVLFLFMNPTAKNISSKLDWLGLRAPWLGTKNIWKLFYALSIISGRTYRTIIGFKPTDWNLTFCDQIYQEVADSSVYITNLAKCTQADAGPINNLVFRKYLPITRLEIRKVDPKLIITFGNQVSSIFLGKSVRTSQYIDNQHEIAKIRGKKYRIFPVCYPVGQGLRNINRAIERMRRILAQN